MENPKIHALAPEHIPGFLASAEGSDPLFTFVAVFLLATILGIGALYFTLHALPEHMAHESNSTQFQVVGILALLALFTHNNLFWVAALLLAAFHIPDFLSPLRSIADSLEAMRKKEP